MSVYADVDSLDSSALLTRITKSSFSFVASAVNNNGERNTLQFNTSEQFVLDYMEQLSTSILSHGEENINFQAHSAKEYLSPSHGMSKPTTLWECCLALRLVHPSRLDSVLKCNMSLKPWIVLMETLIASRRSDYISQFILSLPSHDTIFESIQLWLRELWQQTKDQVKILSENCIAKHLLQKNTKNLPGIENSEFGLNMVVTLELKRLEVLLNGISRVFEACQTINRAGSSGSSGYSATEEQTLHSITTLLSESQCTRDSVAVIRGLCVDPLFSFRAFLPAPLCTPCTSMSQVLQQRRESAADKAYLYYTPEPLRLTTTLRDVHIDNLCSVLATGGSSMTKSKVYGLFNALICARFDKESIDTLLLSLSQTLFLPSEIASSIIQSQSSTPDRELSHARAITIARQLVLYTCLEATLGVMNIDQIDLDVTLLSSQILKVAESVGFSLRLSVSEISFIVSLWKIDANFYVSSAVNELGRHLHSLERIDPLYLQVAVQRLLALGGEDASIGVRKLIGLFFHSASPVGSMMRSQFGVTAIAASGLSESLYMVCVVYLLSLLRYLSTKRVYCIYFCLLFCLQKAWLTAQRLCEESQMPSVDQILARGLVVLMIARWSALTGPAVLDEFLKAPMDENVYTKFTYCHTSMHFY